MRYSLLLFLLILGCSSPNETKVKEDETDVALGDLLHNLNTEMRKTGVNSKVIREVNGKQIEEDTDEYFKNKKK